jgi:phospholipid/cholesterol/gamma-HCH transport system ATP-binding protein
MNKNNPNEIVLEIKNLFKKFENKIILNNLNIKISRGKSIGVMGPSGTGKSILLKCILGLTEYSGQILYNGKTLQGQNREVLYNNSGMLFQGGALFDSLNVWQNVAFKIMNNSSSYSKKDCISIAKKILNEVELGTEIFKNMPSELSGGMQKRVALARAIVNKPNILFFDEPTTGLDPLTTRAINKLIINLVKKNVTSVIISHDPLSIQKICDEVIFLTNGKIEWHGSVEEMSNSRHKMLEDYLSSHR